jgi:hypothetical protein
MTDNIDAVLSGAVNPVAMTHEREMQVFIKSQEQMRLEQAMAQAVSVNNDEAVIDLYNVILMSPYAVEIMSSLPDVESIQQILQRDSERHLLREALASRRVEQIVTSADLVARDIASLSEDEQEIVGLSCRFMDAWQAQDNNSLLEVVETILNSSYRDFLLFTEQEMSYIEQMHRLKQYEQQRHLYQQSQYGQKYPLPLPRQNQVAVPAPISAPATVFDFPDISEEWFKKVCYVKRIYLLHWVYQKIGDNELEQTTLDDLINAPMINEGIRLANHAANAVPLLPEMLLPEIFQSFQNDPVVDYVSLLHENRLTDEQVKGIILIFLNKQLFEEYLLWEQSIKLPDWLQMAHGCDGETFRQQLVSMYPWVKTLSWWRE